MDFSGALYSIVFLLIDIATLVVAGFTIYTAAIAIRTMISNHTYKVGNIIVVPILLFALALALQVLPELYMRSTRIGLERARPERDALRAEIRLWVPTSLPQLPDAPPPPGTPIAIPIEPPTATADPNIGGGGPAETPVAATSGPVATVQPTYTLQPTYTVVPTATPVPTIDPALWNPMTPPPTPPVGGG